MGYLWGQNGHTHNTLHWMISGPCDSTRKSILHFVRSTPRQPHSCTCYVQAQNDLRTYFCMIRLQRGQNRSELHLFLQNICHHFIKSFCWPTNLYSELHCGVVLSPTFGYLSLHSGYRIATFHIDYWKISKFRFPDIQITWILIWEIMRGERCMSLLQCQNTWQCFLNHEVFCLRAEPRRGTEYSKWEKAIRKILTCPVRKNNLV